MTKEKFDDAIKDYVVDHESRINVAEAKIHFLKIDLIRLESLIDKLEKKLDKK